MTRGPGSSTRAAPGADAVHAGVDVGGTKTDAVLVGADGVVLARARVATTRGADGVVSSIHAAIDLAARSLPGAGRAVRAVGIGVPGAVDPLAGVVARAVNIGVEDFPLAAAAEHRLGVPVHVDNDVTLAAWGIARSPIAGAASSLAFVNIGTGLGVGVVIDGRPLRGRHGAAGEIGHLPFDPAGPVCGCGLTGCLELYASGAALARAADPRTVAAMLAEAGTGDPASTAAWERFCAALALVLRIVAQAYDTDLIALGGGVFASQEHFMPRVRALLAEGERASAFVRRLRIPDRLVVVDGAEPFAAVGAAHWARERTGG